MARLPNPASVLAKALVSSGFGVLHSLFLALDANLAHAAAQREVCCVGELPRFVCLPIEQPHQVISLKSSLPRSCDLNALLFQRLPMNLTLLNII